MMRMERAVGPTEPIKPRELIAKLMAIGAPRALAKAQYRRMQRLEWWGNDDYSATVDRACEHAMGDGLTVTHISFHRRDRAPVHDWRDVQQIKSDILGADAEAVELYPAEWRVVDTANEYHLWAVVRTDGTPWSFPFGFPGGARTDDPKLAGAVQRPGAIAPR